MKKFTYVSGEEVRNGDEVLFDHLPGCVEFAVIEKIGDPAMDWYVEQFPGGGVMLDVEGMGNVFLEADDIGEELVFVSRKK